jgi:hypothetical protein
MDLGTSYRWDEHDGMVCRRHGASSSDGPVTAVFRTEHLDWMGFVPSEDAQGRRHTAGAPIRLTNTFALHVNVIRQSGYLAKAHRSSVDLAVTYAIRLR